MTHTEMQDMIRSRMSSKRFNHSLCVAKQAEHLAKLYGADPERAYTAGIFHDMLKEEDMNRQLKLFGDFGILIKWSQIESPAIYHGFAAATYLREAKIVVDDEILSAIAYHTTGKRHMTLLEKIIYIADYTSDDRTFPGAEAARELAEEDLDHAILYTVKATIASLMQRETLICTDTLDLYNQLQIERKHLRGEYEHEPIGNGSENSSTTR